MAEISEVAARWRWGRAFCVLAWLHLAFFMACQGLVWRYGGRPHWPFPVLWLVEVVACFVVMRKVCGRDWIRASPMTAVVARVWGTYFILAFNLSTLNELTGWTVDWFKPVWCTLGTYGFATMAWLFSLWFLVPAVQLYFTGLLMVRYPDLNFLIHGLSWWIALTGIGLALERRRREGVWAGSSPPRDGQAVGGRKGETPSVRAGLPPQGPAWVIRRAVPSDAARP